MSSHTLEGKKKTQNGVKRLAFTVLSILLEVVFLIGIFKGLNEYAVFIDNLTRIFAVILVLKIYGRNETSSMKTPWIILILTLPILGVALYFLIGLNGGTWKMRMRYKKIDEKLLPLLPENKEVLQRLNASDPKAGNVSNYIERNACYPVYQNTDVIYFDEAVKGLEAQLADLAKAEQFIFMEYHAIEDEYAWSRIQTVLEERVKAGVEVRVFYDDMGSIGFVNLSFARKLEAKGIACRVFNPLLPGLNMFLNNRDHRKITVVDGKVGYTGGYNLANEYFNYTHPYGEWKDTGIRLEGDAVASLTAAFLEMWESSGKTPAGVDVLDIEAQKKYLVQHPYQAQQTGYIQPYADCPLDGIQVGEDVYISIVNKADRYCWFMTPYLIITDEMTHALSLAAKRGVDVRIITPGIPDKKLIYSITRSFYHNLVQDGVRIYEWTPGFCHAKMSVADDCMATCGWDSCSCDCLRSCCRKEEGKGTGNAGLHFWFFLFLHIDIYRDAIYNKTKKKANFFTLNYRKPIYNESKYKKGAIAMKVNKNMVSGNTAMLILKLISEKDMYGYEMIDTLSKRSDNVFELKVGTLYPLLHSMVQSGYLESYNQEANGKLRKYYRITPNGKKYLEKMVEEWNAYANAVTSMIQYSV